MKKPRKIEVIPEEEEEQPPAPQLMEIPNFSEEYLNQLSEEQLEQLLQQQQQLLYMQQQQQPKKRKTSRPRSAKPATNFRTLKPPAPVKPPVSASKKLTPATAKPAKKKKKRAPAALKEPVMLNNFFPALEGERENPNMVVQDQIDEVPPEQEEAESQENMFFQAPKGEQDEANPSQQAAQDEAVGFELSDEQLVELVKNVHALSPEQQ